MFDIEKLAKKLYARYCREVGGKAFNGDPLPDWDAFSKDPAKQKQADAWRSVADLAATEVLIGNP
jgi:hypothetical protein